MTAGSMERADMVCASKVPVAICSEIFLYFRDYYQIIFRKMLNIRDL